MSAGSDVSSKSTSFAFDWMAHAKSIVDKASPPRSETFAGWHNLMPEMQVGVVEKMDTLSRQTFALTCNEYYTAWFEKVTVNERIKLVCRHGSLRFLATFITNSLSGDTTTSPGIDSLLKFILKKLIAYERSEDQWIAIKLIKPFFIQLSHGLRRYDPSFQIPMIEGMSRAGSTTYRNLLPLLLEFGPAMVPMMETATIHPLRKTMKRRRLLMIYENAARYGNSNLIRYLISSETNCPSHEIPQSIDAIRFEIFKGFLKSKPLRWPDVSEVFKLSPGWYETVVDARDNNIPEESTQLSREVEQIFRGSSQKKNIILNIGRLMPYFGASIQTALVSDATLFSLFTKTARSIYSIDLFTPIVNAGFTQMERYESPFSFDQIVTFTVMENSDHCLHWFWRAGKLYVNILREDIESGVSRLLSNSFYHKATTEDKVKKVRQWIVDHPGQNSAEVLDMFDTALEFQCELRDLQATWRES